MKQIALGLFGFIGLFAPFTANAARLDVSRLTQDGEFSASFGAAFVSGRNNSGDAQTDFSAGRVRELSLDLDYTFADDWTVAFTTDNDYADSQVGIRYKILKTVPLKLDAIADYGIAWTKDSVTDVRLGDNNIKAGLRIHGVAWDDFQWSFKAMGQFVFAEPANFWNVNLDLQAMYYFRPCMATLVEFEYDFLQISRPTTLYDRSVSVGVVYNMSETASVNPYVKYHFKTANANDDKTNGDDYWKIGLQFSVEF